MITPFDFTEIGNFSLNEIASKFFGLFNGLIGKDLFRSVIATSKTANVATFVLLSVGGYAAFSKKQG